MFFKGNWQNILQRNNIPWLKYHLIEDKTYKNNKKRNVNIFLQANFETILKRITYPSKMPF